MAFITQQDYYTLISADDLELITQSTQQNRQNAEQIAIAQASAYLSIRYDCDAIWRQEGDNRNKALVMVLLDMVLYHLHSHLPGRMGIEIRRQRYDDAIAWLKAVAKGDIIPDLPAIEQDTHSMQINFGSRPKNNPYY